MAKKYVLKSAQGDATLKKYADELNPEQLAAVLHGRGPALVIAGAGSGKTRVVTYRVARLVESGIPPEQILLVTFTNKAAREMLHRVELLLNREINRLWGGTYHHIANRLLRRYAALLGYKSNYTILDSEDSADLIATCVADMEVAVTERRFPKEKVLQEIISFAHNTNKSFMQVTFDKYPAFADLSSEVERVAEFYDKRKRELNVMDYDDLLLNWHRLLNFFPEVREELSNRFSHVLVDEYQDTNIIQSEIVEAMAEKNRNLFVVGDDGQSIYSFRGANFENIMRLGERFPDLSIYKLETNYRSTQPILSLANHCIAKNLRQYPKELRAHRGDGLMPNVVPLIHGIQQAEFVAQRILELRDEDVPLNDIAVLYRSHWNSMEIQMELTRRGIPFAVRSGLRFFEQKHIKDMAAFLRLTLNAYDELSWRRVLKMLPRIGDAKSRKIFGVLGKTPDPIGSALAGSADSIVGKQGQSTWREFVKLLTDLRAPELLEAPQEQIRLVIENGYSQYVQENFDNYRQRLEDLEQLSLYAARFPNVETFLSDIALMTEISGEDVVAGAEEDEFVVLSSVHQAKGLEWTAVFVIWCADGRFPAAQSLRDPNGEEEERRLFYVSCTRAKDELYLCYPMFYQERGGKTVQMKPSRFISEIAQSKQTSDYYETLDVVEAPPNLLDAPRKPKALLDDDFPPDPVYPDDF